MFITCTALRSELADSVHSAGGRPFTNGVHTVQCCRILESGPVSLAMGGGGPAYWRPYWRPMLSITMRDHVRHCFESVKGDVLQSEFPTLASLRLKAWVARSMETDVMLLLARLSPRP